MWKTILYISGANDRFMNPRNPQIIKFTWRRVGVYFLVVFGIVACRPSVKESNKSEKSILPAEKNRVDIMVIRKQDFSRDIVSNGKLAAKRKAALFFKTSGTIRSVNVTNGQYAPAGKILTRLYTGEFELNLQKSRVNLEQAEINRLDRLVGMGYTEVDSAAINPEHLRIAGIRSGYASALIAYREAEMLLCDASLRAPFDGVVEGIVQRPDEKTDLSKPFCTLINNTLFSVDFPLLENEVGQVSSGQTVEISPISGLPSATGRITEINPRIDENGMARLKSEVKNPGGYVEGMNVKVVIRKFIPGHLVVPKSAVVLRDNREILFRYTNGTAFWTYIQILDENDASYAVKAADGARLEHGDTVIISNNLNLAHETEVEIE